MIKNKKALSTVIATVLLILLVVISVGIVWAFVNNFVTEKTEDKCVGLQVTDMGKISIEDSYTCFDEATSEVQFSINVGDIQMDSLLISVLAGGNSQSFTITNEDANYSNIRPYNGNYGDLLKLPGKNEGKTYVANGFPAGTTKVDSIKIAPAMGGKQCDSIDETNEVDSCALFEG